MSFFRKKKNTEKIVPREDFLHGPTRFLKGKTYVVDSDLARYFGNNGWLEGEQIAPPPVVSLEVDDSVLGTEDSING